MCNEKFFNAVLLHFATRFIYHNSPMKEARKMTREEMREAAHGFIDQLTDKEIMTLIYPLLFLCRKQKEEKPPVRNCSLNQ